MTHTFLSAKLDELNEQLPQISQQIRCFESYPPSERQKGIQKLQEECQRAEQALRQKLSGSRADSLRPVSEAYQRIEETIRETRENFPCSPPDMTMDDARADKQLLLAEYMLDFAALASNRALLFSLDAINTQLSQEEKEAQKEL